MIISMITDLTFRHTMTIIVNDHIATAIVEDMVVRVMMDQV